jgi:hypothetical protein
MLKFSPANAKTYALANIPELSKFLQNGRKIYSLDQLAGWSCPFADKCLSKVHVDSNNKRTIKDGPNTEFRCFSASQEVVYPGVYNLRKYNFDLINKQSKDSDVIKLLQESMPKNLGICRIHVDGDFSSPKYFYGWLNFATLHPDRLFYAYTKSLPYWVKYRYLVDKVPNFILTASYGGRTDHLISQENLRYAKVIFTEADAKKLPIDHDDSHAAVPEWKNNNFALLLHGVQPKGSEAAKALVKLKGKGSFSK